MKITCRYITDNPNTFVPLLLLEVDPRTSTWMKVNMGKFPPVELLGVSDSGFYPGIDGRNIYLHINPHNTNLSSGDILTIDRYELYILDILKNENIFRKNEIKFGYVK